MAYPKGLPIWVLGFLIVVLVDTRHRYMCNKLQNQCGDVFNAIFILRLNCLASNTVKAMERIWNEFRFPLLRDPICLICFPSSGKTSHPTLLPFHP